MGHVQPGYESGEMDAMLNVFNRDTLRALADLIKESSQGLAHIPFLRLTGNRESRGVDEGGTSDDWGEVCEAARAGNSGRKIKPSN